MVSYSGDVYSSSHACIWRALGAQYMLSCHRRCDTPGHASSTSTAHISRRRLFDLRPRLRCIELECIASQAHGHYLNWHSVSHQACKASAFNSIRSQTMIVWRWNCYKPGLYGVEFVIRKEIYLAPWWHNMISRIWSCICNAMIDCELIMKL